MLYSNMQMSIYFYTSFILITCCKTLEHLMYCERSRVGFCFFLTNIFQITFKYLQNIVILCFQFVKFTWEKYHMLRTDEDDRMLSLHNEFLSYIFECKWNREIGNLLTEISNFVQFNNKKHLLQCNVKYNDETIKI